MLTYIFYVKIVLLSKKKNFFPTEFLWALFILSILGKQELLFHLSLMLALLRFGVKYWPCNLRSPLDSRKWYICSCLGFVVIVVVIVIRVGTMLSPF